MDIDLLRKDECQPLTTEQMNDIKSQFHPSNTANVNIVPYHIYDEDGEEIKVGEVRKTIDGVKKCKPVYEKVVDFGTCPNNTIKTVAHNISNVEEWVKVRCTFNDTTGRGFEVIISNGNVANNVITNVSSTICSVDSKMNITAFTAKFTLRYTKTTDEWQPV